MFIDESKNCRYLIRIPRGHTEKEPIIFTLRLDAENPILVDDIVIEAEEDSSATVIVKYTSDGGVPAQHCGRTRVLAHQGASVKLVKVQMLQDGATHADVIGGFAGEGARLNVILAELGAMRPLSSCNLILDGEGAAAGLDVVYLGDGERSLDMSYRVEHRGRKSVSNICAKGILLERSRKVLRDTLDFISGASGSKGREEESVLMLSPEVRNVSVPLLLCGEDDVEGEHAASSGRPDHRILFYLMSRGIGELEAKKLLAQAAVSSIVEKIPDAPVRDEILDILSKSIERGGQTA
jgi:Fe-S cluster assembly protein SufD